MVYIIIEKHRVIFFIHRWYYQKSMQRICALYKRRSTPKKETCDCGASIFGFTSVNLEIANGIAIRYKQYASQAFGFPWDYLLYFTHCLVACCCLKSAVLTLVETFLRAHKHQNAFNTTVHKIIFISSEEGWWKMVKKYRGTLNTREATFRYCAGETRSSRRK